MLRFLPRMVRVTVRPQCLRTGHQPWSGPHGVGGPKTPVWDPAAIWCPWASSLLPVGSDEGLDVIHPLTSPLSGPYCVPSTGEDQTWSQGVWSLAGKLDRWTDNSRTGE